MQGSPALYSLTPVAVTPADAEESPLPAPGPGGIRYTPEVVAAPAAWLSATLKSGVVRWTGGVRWSMLGLILVGLLVAGFLVWASFNHGLRSTRPLSMRDFWSNTLVVLAVIAVVRLYKFFDHLFDLGIIMAPSALTPMSADNVTLELRRHGAADTIGELAFVRYTGTCPRCDALVVIFSGEKEFTGRLIGRCRRSPREHVYSFDHVHRIGAPLR